MAQPMRSVIYTDRLLDPRWQKRRLQILERDKWTCQCCGSTVNTLHVHHRGYLSGLEPWEYPDLYLVTACEECNRVESIEAWQVALDRLAQVMHERLWTKDVQSLADAIDKLFPSPITKKETARFVYLISWMAREPRYRKSVIQLASNLDLNARADLKAME